MNNAERLLGALGAIVGIVAAFDTYLLKSRLAEELSLPASLPTGFVAVLLVAFSALHLITTWQRRSEKRLREEGSRLIQRLQSENSRLDSQNARLKSEQATSDPSSFSWQEMFIHLTQPGVQVAIGRPDVIVGLNDGIIPAAILARNLGCATLAYLSLEHDGRTNNSTLGLALSGKTVLVVDDQLYSGETMKKAAALLEQSFGAEHNKLNTYSVFLYDTIFRSHNLTIQPHQTTGGRSIRKAPWSYSPEHAQRYRARA